MDPSEGAQMNAEDHELRTTNMGIVRRYIDAINAWDFDTIRELLTDDAVLEWPWAQPGAPRRIQGIAPIMDFLRAVPLTIEAENLHDLRLDTLHSDPSEVIVEFKSDMTMVMPIEYRNEYIGLFTVVEGRVHRFAEYYDPIAYVTAIGGRVDIPEIEIRAQEQ